MPTVTAADEALSSCSQNAAYSPTIMAAQIRNAKAQAESGNPAAVRSRLLGVSNEKSAGWSRKTS